MKYIDSEKLKAKIKGLQCEQGFEDGDTERGYQIAIKDILRAISSLQQEKVSFKKIVNAKTRHISLVPSSGEGDLEKEIECSIRFLNGHHILENGERWYKGRYEELRDFARHFFELGRKASKDTLLAWAKNMKRICKDAEPIEKAYQTVIDKIESL